MITLISTLAMGVSWASPVRLPIAQSGAVPQRIQQADYYTLSKASALLQKNQYSQARPLLEQVTEADPVNLLALFHLGETYLRMAQSAPSNHEALQLLTLSERTFERVLNLNNEMVLTHFKLGKIALLKGNTHAAKQYYRMGLEVSPNNAALTFNLARVHDQEHEKQLAIEYYQKTLAIEPQFIYAYNNLGLLYEEMGNAKLAEHHYKQALRHDPDYNLARLNLGNLYASQARFKDALTYFQAAQVQEPFNNWVYYYMGNMYLRMNQYEQAAKFYQNATELNPEHATTYYLLAVTLSKLNRLDEAMQASLNYIQREPNGQYASEMNRLIMAVKLSQNHGLSIWDGNVSKALRPTAENP